MKSLQKILVPNLHNFVSGTTVPSTITKKILNCYYAEKAIWNFCTEHFLDWSKNLSDTVQEIAFPKPVKSQKNVFNLKYTFYLIKRKERHRSSKIEDIAKLNLQYKKN